MFQNEIRENMDEHILNFSYRENYIYRKQRSHNLKIKNNVYQKRKETWNNSTAGRYMIFYKISFVKSFFLSNKICTGK